MKAQLYIADNQKRKRHINWIKGVLDVPFFIQETPEALSLYMTTFLYKKLLLDLNTARKIATNSLTFICSDAQSGKSNAQLT